MRTWPHLTRSSWSSVGDLGPVFSQPAGMRHGQRHQEFGRELAEPAAQTCRLAKLGRPVEAARRGAKQRRHWVPAMRAELARRAMVARDDEYIRLQLETLRD